MHESIHIRQATPDDAAQIREIYAPYVTDTAITFEYEIPSTEEFRQRIMQTLQRYPYLVACNESGVILGYAYAGSFKGRAAYDWAVETTVYIHVDKHRCGLGRRLYEELEHTLSARGFQNLNACITQAIGNDDPYVTDQSPKFHEHMGYVKVAHFHKCGLKFGRWYDMIWMEKIIGDHPTEIARPF